MWGWNLGRETGINYTGAATSEFSQPWSIDWEGQLCVDSTIRITSSLGNHVVTILFLKGVMKSPILASRKNNNWVGNRFVSSTTDITRLNVRITSCNNKLGCSQKNPISIKNGIRQASYDILARSMQCNGLCLSCSATIHKPSLEASTCKCSRWWGLFYCALTFRIILSPPDHLMVAEGNEWTEEPVLIWMWICPIRPITFYLQWWWWGLHLCRVVWSLTKNGCDSLWKLGML